MMKADPKEARASVDEIPKDKRLDCERTASKLHPRDAAPNIERAASRWGEATERTQESLPSSVFWMGEERVLLIHGEAETDDRGRTWKHRSEYQRICGGREDVPDGSVRVRVSAIGVCHRDVLERRGASPPLRSPVVLGHEFAGEVVESKSPRWPVGARVCNLHNDPCGQVDCAACGSINDRDPRCSRASHVFGISGDGGYASEVVCPGDALVAVPAAVALRDAAVLMCTAGVALRAMDRIGGLQRGGSVLITGASGGVGVHAVQLARRTLGAARVVAVTSSQEKAAALAALGATEVLVDPTGRAFHRDTAPVDVALDLVGGPTLPAALRAVRPGGRAVVVGNVGLGETPLMLGRLILMEISVAGSSGCSAAELERVFAAVAAGELRPVVFAELPLRDFRAAHDLLLDKSVVGRIVLRPDAGLSHL